MRVNTLVLEAWHECRDDYLDLGAEIMCTLLAYAQWRITLDYCLILGPQPLHTTHRPSHPHEAEE